MKKTIGHRSKGFSIFISVLLILLIVVTLSISSGRNNPFSFMFVLFMGIVCIYLLILLIGHMRKPIQIISHDDLYFYLDDGDHVEKVPILSVIHTQSRRHITRYIVYEFGRIEIHTSDGIFTSAIVAQADMVAKRISKIVNQSKDKKRMLLEDKLNQ